jgi:hypothetical protein
VVEVAREGRAFRGQGFRGLGRGRLFIDGICTAVPEIGRPWKEFGKEADRYALFRFVAVLLALLITLPITLGLSWSIWGQWDADGYLNERSLWSILIGLPVVVITWATWHLLTMVTHDFVVPTMYLRRVGIIDGLGIANRELFKGHFWAMVLFYLMKFLLYLAAGVLAFMVTLCTCCIAAIPFVGTVILLPVFVFLQAWKLYFIEQYGSAWRLLKLAADHPQCTECGYDLRGTLEAEACPECGQPILWNEPPGMRPEDSKGLAT